MGFVYILSSLRKNKYYVGSTNDLERRFFQHKSGKVKSTKGLLPVKLVFSQKFETLQIARRIESKLKKYKNKEIISSIIKDGSLRVRE